MVIILSEFESLLYILYSSNKHLGSDMKEGAYHSSALIPL